MIRWLSVAVATMIAALPASAAPPPSSPGFLATQGEQIVDGNGKPVILRGMGLGGWMLQEGYMLKLPELGQQHVIHQRLAELVGQQSVQDWHRAWLDNFMTKRDMDALGRWGFNAVRLPMHYQLFVDPTAPAGTVRWNEDGFRHVDALLQWAAANRMWVILDLHAAPGGQGTDLAISDRDSARPSLWQSADDQRLTVELWREIARRYANNPWVGGYDILNEPNWDFDGDGGGHGCKDQRNAPIAALYKRITSAIRQNDRNHLIVIEGNCWGNNYAGITPDWDPHLVLSFHKYWNANDDKAIAGILKLREATGRPIWLGESGENSNVWYRDAIKLVERHGIGWSWWPMKKMGFNNPVEVVPNDGWRRIADYLTGKGPKPSPEEARASMMRVATHDILFANLVQHPDVIDAMFRQPRSDAALPFRTHRLGSRPLDIAAVDFDMGPAGVAYMSRVLSDYHVDTGGDFVKWNSGKTYRNDAVDIGRSADGSPFVRSFGAGEWLQYTLEANAAGQRGATLTLAADAPASLSLSVNDGPPARVAVSAAHGWQQVKVPPLPFASGTNRLKLFALNGRVRLKTIQLR